MKRFAAIILLALHAAAAQAQGACIVPGNASQLVTEAGEDVNAARRDQGLRPLRSDARLMQAAQRHACDIARHGQMTHQGADGSNSAQRAAQAGFSTCLTAENIAFGFRRSDQVVAGWLGSAGHRRNILLDRATHFGLGIAEGPRGPMWVMVYARAC